MKRRQFIKLSASAASLSILGVLHQSCNHRNIHGTLIGASAATGHLLRDKTFATPSVVEDKEVVIVGGGISGLSAARYLYQSNVRDFVLMELEQQVGGNASSGSNEVSAYPWGAHYIPTPNNNLKEYLTFLESCGVITGYDKSLPVYNDYYICFDPEERLYINGSWQEGLVPQLGVSDQDKQQLKDFFRQMETFRHAKGKDGKDAFAIPVDTSSVDDNFTRLDSFTMKQWMDEQGYTGEYIRWYLNYCCRDDFGTPYDKISAWMGIHYFAGRKGVGANVNYHDVITWPQGNGWLAEQLKKDYHPLIKTQHMVVSVKPVEDAVLVTYLDVQTNALHAIRAKHCVLAVPQFVAARLLQDAERIQLVHGHLQYVPWLVANLKVNELTERSGMPACWDNVIYRSASLGYVEATHQLVKQESKQRNLTYYLPLTALDPVAQRKEAIKKTYSEWVDLMMDDLKLVHPDIAEKTEQLDIMLWGHAMIQPLPGLAFGQIRKQLSAPVNNRIHFAHTDIAGISIFEEAFYQGLNAAKAIIADRNQ